MGTVDRRKSAVRSADVGFDSLVILVKFKDGSIRQLLLSEEQQEYLTDAILTVASTGQRGSVRVLDEDLSAGLEIQSRDFEGQKTSLTHKTSTVM